MLNSYTYTLTRFSIFLFPDYGIFLKIFSRGGFLLYRKKQVGTAQEI
jgi:hypothetical protein